MALQPLRDIIAVIPLGDSQKVGSLFIPETAKQRTDQGVVLYRGPQCRHLRVGDHVFFSGYTGTKVTIEPQGELIFMKETDVFFYDDGEPTEAFVTHSQLIEFIDKAAGELSQRVGAGLATYDTAAIVEIAEQLKDILNRRLASGLEF